MTADVHTLAGAYALDALPAEEREFFERHLAVCEPCRQEVDEFTSTAAVLGAAASEPPPPSLRSNVLAQVDVTRQLPPPTAVQGEWTWRLRPATWLAAAMVLVLALGVGTVASQLRLPDSGLEVAQRDLLEILVAPDARTVVLSAPPGVTTRFVYSPSLNRGVLASEGLQHLPPDQVYELWLAHGGEFRPAGLFQPGPDGVTTASVEGPVAGAEQIAVSIEPAGGVPAPTGEVVAHAKL